MGRALAATIVGAVIVFVWGVLSWTVLPFHHNTVLSMDPAAEAPVVAALRANVPGTGAYFIPGMPRMADADTADADMTAWQEAHRQGPVGMLIYNAGGIEPMSPRTFIQGFVIDLVAAALVVGVLSAVRRKSYLDRVGVTVIMGAFAALVSHLTLWNYVYFPLHYSMMLALDVIIAWALAGIVMGLIVKPAASGAT